MKQIIFMTMLVAGLMISCDADDNPNVETPSVVLNTFQSNFPNALDIEWEKARENFEVEFELDQIEHTALLSSDGMLIKYKYDMLLSELPETVRQYLKANYETNEIDDVEALNVDESVYYQVEIDKILSSDKVILNSNGEIAQDIEYMD